MIEKKNKDTTIVASSGDVIILSVCERTCFVLTSDADWVIDTGASFHCTSRMDIFISYQLCDFGVVRMGNSGISKLVGKCHVYVETHADETYTRSSA